MNTFFTNSVRMERLWHTVRVHTSFWHGTVSSTVASSVSDSTMVTHRTGERERRGGQNDGSLVKFDLHLSVFDVFDTCARSGYFYGYVSE